MYDGDLPTSALLYGLVMTDVAIRVDDLSKLFKIGHGKMHYDTLRDQLVAGVTSLFRRNSRSPDSTFWALRDVSLEIKRAKSLVSLAATAPARARCLRYFRVLQSQLRALQKSTAG